MSREAFEELWSKAGSAPQLTEIQVKKIEPDLSFGKIVERIERSAEQAVTEGRLKKADFDELLLHTGNLKKVLQKADPDNSLLAIEMRNRIRRREMK